MSNKFNETLVEALRKTIETARIKAGESARDVFNIIQSDIKNKIDNISVDDILSCIKTAWNLEEIEIEELSLEKCISIIKSEFNKELYSSACILDKKDVDRNSKYRFEIHICFLDKANEPMLNGNAKHWIVHTNALNKDLLNQFGSKNMIILK